MVWTAIERINAYFYDPVIFWGVPFALALVLEGYRLLRGGSR